VDVELFCVGYRLTEEGWLVNAGEGFGDDPSLDISTSHSFKEGSDPSEGWSRAAAHPLQSYSYYFKLG
jgi:hypothetical protein